MANKINISPVISPNIVETVSKSASIKSFGSQLKDKSKEILVIGDQTKTAQLDNEFDTLTKKEQDAGIEKTRIEEEAIYKLNTKQITQDQYNKIIETASASLIASKAIISLNQAKLQLDKNNIVNNPYTPVKENQNIINREIKNLDRNIRETENKSKKDLIKQVLTNPTKNLASILSLQLSNSLSILISQRKKLEELVDQVNTYIDTQVKDETTVTIATNLRNNAILLINNSIKKIDNISKIIKTINAVIIIISLVLVIIERILSLPIPFLLPLKVELQPRLQKIIRLLSAVSVLLTIISVLLSNETNRLIELKERLKQISLKLDNKAIDNLTEQQLTELSNIFLPTGGDYGSSGGDYGSYKDFKFAIKEEQNNPQFIVKGNKRKYAVAINRRGVESIKSEYSFTQDPNDLIEQLKLIIDQQNLQG
jgi:hypothetical protein